MPLRSNEHVVREDHTEREEGQMVFRKIGRRSV